MADNNFDVLSVIVNQDPKIEVVEKPELLYGINELITDAQTLKFDDNGKLVADNVKLTMIPYYAWNHRGAGQNGCVDASRPYGHDARASRYPDLKEQGIRISRDTCLILHQRPSSSCRCQRPFRALLPMVAEERFHRMGGL